MLSGNEMIQHNETIKVKGTNEKKKKKTNGLMVMPLFSNVATE